MNIFDAVEKNKETKEVKETKNIIVKDIEDFSEMPLAARMRPTTIDEIIGQEHILGKDKLLYRAIKSDKLSSVIFYGPPGTGKTTIAKVIANTTKSDFCQINATIAGKKDMQDVIEHAKEQKAMRGRRTILFIDEIHRFNKSQQDFLLPFVENGTVILIGATTENPYFEVNSALISRSIIFQLHSLNSDDILELINRTITSEKNGYKDKKIVIDEEAKLFLARLANGDARKTLSAIEIGVETTAPDESGITHITLDIMRECIQERAMQYDKDGDNHYNTISAFIKSMRGSDPDAAVYYLARMLKSGEDIKFIARRIMICASEDVGNADPMAIVVATNASLACERIGMPEAQIILSQAASYVACAPKSNASCVAISTAMEIVEQTGNLTIPTHLRDAHYKGAAKLGNGLNYKYPHDYPNNWCEQQYLPDEINGTKIYNLSDNGYEREIKERFEKIKK